MNSRDIIIICATVIILLAIGIFLMANPFGSGETAILTMESSQSLTEGDSLILKLSDENKTPIAGQRIEINLTAKYNGNKNYKQATLSGNIYVKKKANSSSSDKYKTDHKVDDVIDGWDPKEHEVSREALGDGTYRITYDDGYFRIVDEDGNILTYGY